MICSFLVPGNGKTHSEESAIRDIIKYANK